MRRLERTLQWVQIAPRAVRVDALGGRVEDFSVNHIPVRARVLPSSEGLRNRETGLTEVQTMCLLMPVDTPIAPGDGVCIGEDTPRWRCTGVQRWSAHMAVSVERRAQDSGVDARGGLW